MQKNLKTLSYIDTKIENLISTIIQLQPTIEFDITNNSRAYDEVKEKIFSTTTYQLVCDLEKEYYELSIMELLEMLKQEKEMDEYLNIAIPTSKNPLQELTNQQIKKDIKKLAFENHISSSEAYLIFTNPNAKKVSSPLKEKIKTKEAR